MLPTFPDMFNYKHFHYSLSPKPHRYCYPWFGLLPFRSPLLRSSLIYFLFLQLLRCFSSLGSLHNIMYSCYDTMASPQCVSTFGDLRIIAHLQLPAAYRSQSRPSSAFSAKAFSICSLQLDRLFVPLINVLWQNYKLKLK